jgi:putrescine transport system ATP-binding protein
LDIQQGEIFALLGSSGSGKSTLLRMLAGFELPSSGQIILAGKDIVSLAPYERPINMMFQSYALFPHLTVWDNIAFGLRRDGMAKADIDERVAQMLELVQLKPYAKRKPHQLSGGQQQRVALARSLAKRPQLLLLDEPLGALDAKLRERTQLELVDIIEKVGVTCVLVTHDQEEAMTMATRIGVMSEGKILQVGKPSDIYETPNCRFVADFIGSVNLFKGTVEVDEADHVVVASPECKHYVSHGITGTQGMTVHVAVRPEKMTIQKDLPQDEERESPEQVGFNIAQGTIKDMAYLGSLTTYHVQLDAGGPIVKVTHTNAARRDASLLTWGDKVYVWWCGSDIVLLTS